MVICIIRVVDRNDNIYTFVFFRNEGTCHGSRDLLVHPVLLVPLEPQEVLLLVMVVAIANLNKLQLSAHQAHLAHPDLLDQKENLEVQETRELQEDPDLKDPPASMELLVALDRPVNEAPMEGQALLVDLDNLEPRERLA